MAIEGICKDNLQAASLGILNPLEITVQSCMIALMIALQVYIIVQIKTKNIWNDLEKEERILLKILMALSVLAGIRKLCLS
jgi:hypothetical protein